MAVHHPGRSQNLRDLARMVRQIARETIKHASIGDDGGIAVLDSDEETRTAYLGKLPDNSRGVGVVIAGAGMVNIATWAKTQVDSLSNRITAEKNRNDSQDSTLASHNTRITTAQTTANGAVSVNTTQNSRLDAHGFRLSALEDAVGGAASGSALSALTALVGLLINQVDGIDYRLSKLETAFKSVHPGVLP